MTGTDAWEQLGRDLALERHSHAHSEYRPSARQRVAEAAMVEVIHNAERTLSTRSRAALMCDNGTGETGAINSDPALPLTLSKQGSGSVERNLPAPSDNTRGAH